MLSETQNETIGNSKTADSGGKLMFEDPVLCSQFLRDYADMDLLKDIRPEDIEDVTERYIPMFTEERNADVVKKVRLRDKGEVFITLIEHKSGVDYNVVMQILRYMIFIWEDYEKQREKEHRGISDTKSFKYPPILPIVYYEGKEEWTADRNFSERITLNEVFGEYTPKFRYCLVSLNKYGKDELISKKDEMSFLMLINSIKSAEEFRKLDLPNGYLDDLLKSSPESVLTAISNIVSVVLRKQNVSEDEIWKLKDQIKRRKHMALFDDWEGFDVQAERKKGEEIHLIKIVCKKILKGLSPEEIADIFEEDEAHIKEIYTIAKDFAPEYDAEKIYEKLSKEVTVAVQ